MGRGKKKNPLPTLGKNPLFVGGGGAPQKNLKKKKLFHKKIPKGRLWG